MKNSMDKKKNSRTVRIFEKTPLAVVFGATFWLFDEFAAQISKPIDCWDSQDDSWLSKNQLALVFSATLSFFILELLKIVGWKGFFKAIGVSYLCFQIFSLTYALDAIYTQHCFFPEGFFGVSLIYSSRFAVAMLLLPAFVTVFFTILRSVFKRFLKFLFPENDDFLKLSLDRNE